MDAVGIAIALALLKTPSQISQRLAELGATYGFPVHAISPVPTPERPMEDGWFMVQNWPAEWGRTYVEEGFGAFDPVPRAAAVLAHPMTISELRQGAAGFLPDPRAARLFDLATRLGQSHGLIIPVFGPLHYRGVVCFAGRGPDPDPRARTALHLIGLYAHDRIRDLVRTERLSALALTAREREILIAAGRGQDDAEIASALGITVRTVRFHFAGIRRKFGADSRAHALAMAANLGILGK